MDKTSIGDRMKKYENVTRNKLIPRMYTIIRIDGKAFHTYTKGLKRPFDAGLLEDMNQTAIYLCRNIMGCKIGYVQSDEISLVLTDFDTHVTQAWFDGNIQKIASIAASMATAKFNQLRMIRYFIGPHNNIVIENDKTIGGLFEIGVDLTDVSDDIASFINYVPQEDNFLAMFDARVFQVPNRTEAINYLIWRQQDAVRNSISSVAQSIYSHKELHGVNTNQMQELIFQKGINWNDYSVREKRGGIIRKINVLTRTTWILDNDAPEINKDWNFYENIIPNNL